MLTKFPVRILTKPQKYLRLCPIFSKTIMTWQEEKQKYLKMTFPEKRALGPKSIPLSEIPTWKSVLESKKRLAKKIPRLPNKEINPTLNKDLAGKISYYLGDITKLEVDAIVNAANKSLLGGAGVDGAIHRAAGSSLLGECKTLLGCNVGEAKITGGYKLPARYVIHTVGPQGEKPDLLGQCYKNSLKVMIDQCLRTIAFPCVSTGIYGYPIEPAAHVAVNEVRTFLESNANKVDRIIFCLFADVDEVVYQGVLQSYFPLE